MNVFLMTWRPQMLLKGIISMIVILTTIFSDKIFTGNLRQSEICVICENYFFMKTLPLRMRRYRQYASLEISE
jgi:hypothetical protein